MRTAIYTTEMAAACPQPSTVDQETRKNASWYCIHARPKKENRIAGYLRETLGFDVYFPRLKRQRTIRRIRRVVTEPLFPRYLFCRFNFLQNHRAVRYAPDVIKIVDFGGVPAAVDEHLIQGLKDWAGEVVDIMTLQPTLSRGDQVEITDGPMRGLRAVILNESCGRERVAVVLSILERNIQVKISRWQLTRAG